MAASLPILFIKKAADNKTFQSERRKEERAGKKKRIGPLKIWTNTILKTGSKKGKAANAPQGPFCFWMIPKPQPQLLVFPPICEGQAHL